MYAKGGVSCPMRCKGEECEGEERPPLSYDDKIPDLSPRTATAPPTPPSPPSEPELRVWLKRSLRSKSTT